MEPSMNEVKEAVDSLAKTFEDHKTANDERLKEIEKKGSASSDHDEKLGKIDKALNEQQDNVKKLVADMKEAVALKERMDAVETRLNRSGTGDGPGGVPKEVKEASKLFWLQPSHEVSAVALSIEKTVENFLLYNESFSLYLRKGNQHPSLSLDGQKALSVGVEADGGYWVKPEMLDRIVTRTFETSPMRQISNVITIGTDALEFVNDPNDATSGGWVGEKASRAETATPQVGMTRISVHEQFANPRITQKLLDDAQFNVESWLSNKIADKLGRVENTAFVTGNGVDQPRGFLDYSGAAVTTDDASRTWGVLQYVFTGKSAGFDDATVDATAAPADELIDVMSKLKPQFRNGAIWLMPRSAEAAVRKLRTTTGDYVVTIHTGNIQGVPLGSFNLFGFPILNAEDMPDIAANSFSVAFGNFREAYQIVERQGVRVLRDPFSAKPFIQFYTTKRVGGDVVNFDAIKLLKFGTS